MSSTKFNKAWLIVILRTNFKWLFIFSCCNYISAAIVMTLIASFYVKKNTSFRLMFSICI